MIKMLAAIRRKPGMTRAEFLHYIQHTHGALAAEKQLGVRHYVQNHVDDAAFGDAADRAYALTLPRDNVTELYFDSFDTMKATFGDPYSRSVIGPDGANFNDFPSAVAMLTEEAELAVPDPRPGAGGVKIMQFVKAADGVEPAALRDGWAAAHAQAAAGAGLRRAVHSLRLPAGDPILVHFGASEMPRYDGVASLWFDAPDPVAAFRAYARAMPLAGLTVPSLGFFLVVRELTIFGDPAA